MPPAARVTDMHTCPMITGEVPHVGGPIVSGEATVLVGYMPAARVSDLATCVGLPDTIVKGASNVLIGYMLAARVGDQTAHSGVIVAGCQTVLIGESGSGGFGGANTPCGAAAIRAKKSRAAMRARALRHREAAARAKQLQMQREAAARAKQLQMQAQTRSRHAAAVNRLTTQGTGGA